MITLKNELLKFDITGILGAVINQHIDFYKLAVGEAHEYMNKQDDRTALSILRVLKSQLDKEYKYYNSKRFVDFGLLNDANNYVNGINKARRSLVGTPDYKNMRSMLYDIQDYMTSVKYENNEFYGNIYALNTENRLYEMTDQEYNSRFGILLQEIRAFYIRPGKGTAKECFDLSKGFSTNDVEPYIFPEYFAKYLR